MQQDVGDALIVSLSRKSRAASVSMILTLKVQAINRTISSTP